MRQKYYIEPLNMTSDFTRATKEVGINLHIKEKKPTPIQKELQALMGQTAGGRTDSLSNFETTLGVSDREEDPSKFPKYRKALRHPPHQHLHSPSE